MVGPENIFVKFKNSNWKWVWSHCAEEERGIYEVASKLLWYGVTNDSERAIGRSENPGVPVIFVGNNLVSTPTHPGWDS